MYCICTHSGSLHNTTAFHITYKNDDVSQNWQLLYKLHYLPVHKLYYLHGTNCYLKHITNYNVLWHSSKVVQTPGLYKTYMPRLTECIHSSSWRMSSKFYTLRMFGGSTLEQTLPNKGLKLILFSCSTSSWSVYLGRHLHNTMDQSFPLSFCMLYVSG